MCQQNLTIIIFFDHLVNNNQIFYDMNSSKLKYVIYILNYCNISHYFIPVLSRFYSNCYNIWMSKILTSKATYNFLVFENHYDNSMVTF